MFPYVKRRGNLFICELTNLLGAFLSYSKHYTLLCINEKMMLCFSVCVLQECDKANVGFPNFNFNASHHGDYVAIASEPICLVGLDIVSHFTPEKETVPEFIQNFESYFSSVEWDNIVNAGTSDEMLVEFYRYNDFSYNFFTQRV